MLRLSVTKESTVAALKEFTEVAFEAPPSDTLHQLFERLCGKLIGACGRLVSESVMHDPTTLKIHGLATKLRMLSQGQHTDACTANIVDTCFACQVEAIAGDLDQASTG